MTRLDEMKIFATNHLNAPKDAELVLKAPDFWKSADDILWLISRVEKLEAALKFYADGRKVRSSDPYCSVWEGLERGEHPIEFGTRARSALSESETE